MSQSFRNINVGRLNEGAMLNTEALMDEYTKQKETDRFTHI